MTFIIFMVVPGAEPSPVDPMQVLADAEPVGGQRREPGGVGGPPARVQQEPEREPGLARLARLVVRHVVPAAVERLVCQEPRPPRRQPHSGQGGRGGFREAEPRAAIAAGGTCLASTRSSQCRTARARPPHAHQQQPHLGAEGQPPHEERLFEFEQRVPGGATVAAQGARRVALRPAALDHARCESAPEAAHRPAAVFVGFQPAGRQLVDSGPAGEQAEGVAVADQSGQALGAGGRRVEADDGQLLRQLPEPHLSKRDHKQTETTQQVIDLIIS